MATAADIIRQFKNRQAVMGAQRGRESRQLGGSMLGLRQAMARFKKEQHEKKMAKQQMDNTIKLHQLGNQEKRDFIDWKNKNHPDMVKKYTEAAFKKLKEAGGDISQLDDWDRKFTGHPSRKQEATAQSAAKTKAMMDKLRAGKMRSEIEENKADAFKTRVDTIGHLRTASHAARSRRITSASVR